MVDNDISLENTEVLEKLRDRANKDPLTGLYNSSYFFEAGSVLHAASFRGGISLAVLMLDMDHLNRINSSYCNEAGEMVIKRCAEIISSFFRRKTDIVARMGGEGFCILTSYDNIDHFFHFVEILREHVATETIRFDGKDISFTLSIGICTKILKSLDETVKGANGLLYKAKNSGRNTCCIDANLST